MAIEPIGASGGPPDSADGDATLAGVAGQAAAVLRGARRPLVCGLGLASTEAIRIGLEIADRLGGVADWTAGPASYASAVAFQTVGGVAISYGEAAARCDLLVFWGCDPQPLPGFDRIRPADGDGGERYTVSVGVPQNEAGPPADEVLPLTPGASYEAIATLRALSSGLPLDPDAIHRVTGVPLDAWRGLQRRLASARYGVIVRGSGLSEEGPAAVAALTTYAQRLQAQARVAILSPPSEHNHGGAENVMAWQTGYPLAVDFGQGFPRYSPGEYTAAELLDRGECDAVLEVRRDVGSGQTSVEARRLDGTAGTGDAAERVALPVAPLREGGGTYYRADGAALPLPREPGLPAAAEVLGRIRDTLAAGAA
ncbi:MAG: hypothetical protein AAF790_05995 [Planctomycetota bacterium]